MAQLDIMEGTSEELIALLRQRPKERFRLITLPQGSSFQSFEAALERELGHTQEEVSTRRARILQMSPPPQELPAGRTLEEVVMGKWQGDETDEEIITALERLS